LLGAGRPPNTAYSIGGKKIVREPAIPQISWEEVETSARRGGIPRLRLATAGGGPFPGMAAIKDGKYVPLPAGLDKEWIEYIKSGKVPPLLGAARWSIRRPDSGV